MRVRPAAGRTAPPAGSAATPGYQPPQRRPQRARAAGPRGHETPPSSRPGPGTRPPGQTGPTPGRRDCGCLEDVLVREWAADAVPDPESVTAINRLADLPLLVKEKLAAGLDAIHVGAGGVPDLDDMGGLTGVPLPSGRATWDACAGAYGDRKIIVGSRPSPTPDVMCHEVGHALDDLDGDGRRLAVRLGRLPGAVRPVPAASGQRVSPAQRLAGPPGVLRRRVRGDRVEPAARTGGDAVRRHQDQRSM